MRVLSAVAAGLLALAAPAFAADQPAKRLLLVTDSGGFIHDSVGFAEDKMKELGPKYGFAVTCYRFTRDPDKKVTVKNKDGTQKTTTALEAYSEQFRARTGKPVEKEHCGRVNAETLKTFDAVLFFTTGNPLTPAEVKDLAEWVKAGGAYAGTHCASDTLYSLKNKGIPENAPYAEIVGGYFVNHPWHQKVKLRVEDPAHAGAKGFKDGDEITDEIYQFVEPYSREKLHIILSVDNSSIDTKKKEVVRGDKDFAVAWCKELGKGKAFYTSLGHRKEVWADPRFQQHLFGGVRWALGLEPGDATPSAKLKSAASN